MAWTGRLGAHGSRAKLLVALATLALGLVGGATPAMADDAPHADDFALGRELPAPAGVTASPTATVTSSTLLAATPRKVAVFLINFDPLPETPWTEDQVRTAVFTGTGSVNAYYQEQSFGVVSLTGKVRSDGDVFGWYTITADTSMCEPGAWRLSALLQAQASGVDTTGYQHYVYLFTGVPACGWAGSASLGGTLNYINGTTSVRVIAHELGHNLGSHHAAALNCVDGAGVRVTHSTSCTTSEYGDPFDVMGSSDRHGVALRKVAQGWHSAASQQTVTATGSYELSSSSVAGAGVRSLRIPRGVDGNSWYLELRSPTGVFDDFAATDPAVTGVGIRLATDSIYDRTYLVDAQPATATFGDAPLRVGNTFTDQATGVAFTLESLVLGVATVRVAMPSLEPPVAPPPPATITPAGPAAPVTPATPSPPPVAVVSLRRLTDGSGVVRVTMPVPAAARSCAVRLGTGVWTACRIVNGNVSLARRTPVRGSTLRVAVRIDGVLAAVTQIATPRVGRSITVRPQLRITL